MMNISKHTFKEFEKEYPRFCKWAHSEMSPSDFLEFMILQAKDQRVNHRPAWLIYSITKTRIKILDRRQREKIIVRRIHDYLFCVKDKKLECDHCLMCLNDKEVKESLNPKYVWQITRAYKPTVIWPKLHGQKLNFDEIIGNKSFFDNVVVGDYAVEF